MRTRLAAAVLAVVATLALSACAHDRTGTASRAGTCLDGLSGPPADAGTPPPAGASGAGPGPGGTPGSAGSEPAAGSAGSGAASGGPSTLRLPDLALACFDGTGDVRLDTLTRPAVVSLWASWCAPCRDELPQLDAYWRAAGGKVAVIGVDTLDDRTHAGSMISDDGLGYPMLFDPDKRLAVAIGHTVLPVTLFVAPGGVVRHVYLGGTTPIDRATLARLTAQYLGVRVGG